MKRTGKVLLLALALVLLFALPVGAAAKKNTFVKKNGNYYYYNSKGKKAKGLTTVGKKTYYFDSNGVQRLGWRVIGGKYYYFYISNGKKGYMAKSKTIDGIRLNSKGAATGGSEASRKLWVLAKAQTLVDANTTPSMSKAAKRKAMYVYTKNAYGNVIIPDLMNSGSNWDVYYAEFLFSRRYGDCYAYAAGFAYFMNAIGYSDVIIEHSGSHCWVNWKNHFFDPHWDMTYRSMLCYNAKLSQCGVGGRPNWDAIAIGGKPVDSMGW